MFIYILKRMATSLVTIWMVVTITFFLMHAIPGGPFTREKALPPAVMKNIEERYHLNDPLWKQYTDYIQNLVRGDLGPSFKYQGVTVNQIIAESFPISAQLGLASLFIMLFVGLPAGIISALRQTKWQDHLAMSLATVGVAVPNFVVATLLMYIVGVKLGWLPTARWLSWQSVIMPSIALAGYYTAYVARLTRSSVLEVLQQDYIRTARAKGLPERVVVYKHALKNALIPIVTYLGPISAGILTGSFVIEKIFAIPGLGEHFVASIWNRDYTVILGVTVFYATLLVIVNLIVDILYCFIDPRIRLGK
ncbi:MAG TPA: ABC transporter permease [Desulfotomaculum sp.]|nr:MAG: peptide ABC transporter permease [Desulfotomaculum sp. BICA1-6]HBX24524.1 ABC transporter permease [Desulfotomaculum sp.]